MKKTTKFDERIENAFNAFFETENPEGQTNLAFVANNSLAEISHDETFSQKADQWISSAKKILLFFPGVLSLHLITFSTVFFYRGMGLNSRMLFFFAAGIFMVWAGLGNLRSKKHLLLPLSVIASILPFAVLFSFLPQDAIEYSFYLFPIFFAVPLLVKSWLDKMDKDFD